MLSKSLTVAALVVPLLLLACTPVERQPPPLSALLAEATGQDGRACVEHLDIRGYGILDHNVVSIDGGRKYYLMTLLPGCHDLEVSFRAMLKGRFHEVCGGRLDKLITPQDRCTIDQLFEFASRKDAFAAYDSAKPKPGTDQAL